MPFKITAQNRDQSFQVTVNVAGPTLLEILQAQNVPIKSSCMGKGVCRQCRVQVQRGLAPVQSTDRKVFNEEQLQAGWRLSCGIRPKAPMEIFFPQTFVFQDAVQKFREPVSAWWYACDLGTTGVEIAAVDTQGTWALAKSLNLQVTMGADVMTRLEYAMKNGLEPLFAATQKQLLKLCSLIAKATDLYQSLNKMYVAGNSAVTSFLVQAPVEQLGLAPYEPAFFEEQNIKLSDLSVRTLPLLHSFVGGDLWAGLFFLWQQELFHKGSWVLMDVGTNSEILFWDNKKLFVSSTPAGPAFEGSSISIGMRAEPGAIIHPKYLGQENIFGGVWDFKTVGDDIPKGICGSALVEMISNAVAAGIVTPDGEVLNEQTMKLTRTLSLSQDDVREFQLAKSAIQTGLQLVRKQSDSEPQTLYLAGSFGENLPLEQSRHIGLIPDWNVVTLGNASLEGTIAWGFASEQEHSEFAQFIAHHKQPIELALSDEFQETFVKNMNLTRF